MAYEEWKEKWDNDTKAIKEINKSIKNIGEMEEEIVEQQRKLKLCETAQDLAQKD